MPDSGKAIDAIPQKARCHPERSEGSRSGFFAALRMTRCLAALYLLYCAYGVVHSLSLNPASRNIRNAVAVYAPITSWGVLARAIIAIRAIAI